MIPNSDLTIVGGGLIGLSTAMWASFINPDLSIVVLEKERQVASHQSGHNSGVIHSGIYYRPGSEKAKLCVAGAGAMIEFCREYGLPYEICGKLVIATSPEQMPNLKELRRRGTANGVAGLRLLEPDEWRDIEPNAVGVGALHVPGAAITDYPAVARQYAEIAGAAGVQLFTATELLGIRKSSDGFFLETTGGSFESKLIVNCAGLHCDRIAAMAGCNAGLKIVPFRGEYYELIPSRRDLIKALIYPVADPRFPFLGVHFTRHVNGGVEAGPNAVLALKREGYGWKAISARDALDMACFPGMWRMTQRYWRSGLQEMRRSLSKTAFVHSLQQLVPAVRDEDLVDGGSGVRAQAVNSQGSLLDDFHFVPQERALHVCNVPSPAATASIMIGRRIVQMMSEQLRPAFRLGPTRSDSLLSKWWLPAQTVSSVT
jgi:L-2-hydroxyglutarate oxidase